MEHFELLVEFLTREELEKELFAALMVENNTLAKVISDELFERKLAEYEE